VHGGIVPLSFQSRRVGDITVVTCSGRIVEGAESAALQQHLNDLLHQDPYLILHLGAVDFIDSSGVGLLVRFFSRTQLAGGSLNLCDVSPRIREVLKITRLNTIFESYESEADAIAASYRRARATAESFRKTNILCVEKSADVLAYVRELLRQAGYDAVTTGNLADALTLLKATRPKLVVIGADLMRLAKDTGAAETFNGLADALSVIELPPDFSSQDAGEAGHHLLDQVRAIMGAADASATAAP
jgi:anti-sigma B factor antagonist